MRTLRSQSIPITFIFPIFIIQCLLLDGLLCYQYDGHSNPPSPRLDAGRRAGRGGGYRDYNSDDVDGHQEKQGGGAYRPSSSSHGYGEERAMTSWGQEPDEGQRELDVRGMPSPYLDVPDISVRKTNEEEEGDLYSENTMEVQTDNEPRRRYRHHNHHHQHQTAASGTGQGRKKNHLPPGATTTAINADYHNPNLRLIPHPDKAKIAQNKHESARGRKSRRYKTISDKEIHAHRNPQTPNVPKLVDKKSALQGANRYEKLSDTRAHNPPRHVHYSELSESDLPHSPPQEQPTTESDWERLVRIDDRYVTAQVTTFEPSSHLPYPTSSQRSYDSQTQSAYRVSSRSSVHFPSKRSSSHHHPSPPDEMYQADEPDDDQLEAYIEALHHVEEMETCSSIRCKDPQPFVQYMHDALNKNKMFFPQCTILHRCMNFTGCCGDMRRECVPKKTSVIRKAFLVVDMSTISHDIMTFDPTNARMIELVNHTECECREKPRQRRCPKQCSVPLQLVQEGHDCFCDCQPVAGGEACENVKHGVVPLSIDGLVCIKEDNCYKPQCSFGSFDVKTGFCPLSDIYALPRHMFRHEEERRNYRNHLKGMGVEYAEIFIKVSAGNKGTPQPNTHRQGKDKQKRTNKESPSRPDKKPRSGSHKTTSSNKPAPHRRTKSKNKSKQSKSKNQNNSKRERKRFKHGGTFSAQDFLQGMVPSHPLSHSGPNSRTVHGAAYNFKKKNVRTKPARSPVDTEHPTPPQSLSMPRVPHASTRTRNPSYIETVKDTLTASPKVKATDIASTVSNSTAISNVPSPSSPHVTTSKLPSSSVRAKSPISRPSSSKTDKHNMGGQFEPITSSQNRTVLAQTQTTSTAQPPQISSSVPTPTLHTNTSILQKTNQRSSLSSSSTQEMFTNVLSSSFATTTSPSISTSSNSDRKDAANTREIFEIFNNKVDNPGGDRAAISSENDKDSLGEVTEIDNSVEDEGAPVEGSGSDAET